MDDSDPMEMEAALPEFTLAEVMKMESLFKQRSEQPMSQEFYEKTAAKFNRATHRAQASSLIKWEQVQNWFQDKQKQSTAEVMPYSEPEKPIASSKTAIVKKRVKEPTISASEAAEQLPDLMFEARSAKDYAWFDVALFLSYKVLHSGELVVRVRFAGFGKEEDEWVSVKRSVRERSIPLEPSECSRVDVGDLVLCYREAEYHALYCDAHVIEIERKSHDNNCCTCVFVVRYDHDDDKDKVSLNKICCRPTRSNGKEMAREITWFVEGIKARELKDEAPIID